MAILADRYKFLDTETSVPTGDFDMSMAKEIYNSVNNEYKELSKSIKNIIGSVKSGIAAAMDYVNGIVADITGFVKGVMDRITNDILPIISDALALPGEIMNDIFGGMDGVLGDLLGGLGSICIGGNGKGYKAPGRGFKPSVGCGSGHKAGGKCLGSANALGKILDMFGGIGSSISKLLGDVGGLLAAVLSLGNAALSLNLCGAFGALSKLLDTFSSVNRAASSLLGSANASHNTLGYMDISNTVISRGLSPRSEYPSVVRDAVSNFSYPDSYKESAMSGFYEGFDGASEAMGDPYYSDDGATGSIFRDSWSSPSSGARDAMQSSLVTYPYNDSDYNVVPEPLDSFTFGAIADEVF